MRESLLERSLSSDVDICLSVRLEGTQQVLRSQQQQQYRVYRWLARARHAAQSICAAVLALRLEGVLVRSITADRVYAVRYDECDGVRYCCSC